MANETALQKARALISSGLPQTKQEAKRLLQQAEEQEVVVYLLLEIAKLAHQGNGKALISPSTPSGMIPLYNKPSASNSPQKNGVQKNQKKAGGQPGHKGSHRPQPERIDRQEEHRLDSCPDCGGPLQRCNGEQSIRSRIIEDIPQEILPEVTEHVLHRDYCPRCGKSVEPKVDSALPQSMIGNRLLVLTAFWHYCVGMTISQILDTLNYHLQFKLSKGGLIGKWHQLQIILMFWYESLAADVQKSAVLHCDETGWRVNGQTHWLWCFTSADTTYYMVDHTRGSPALLKFFKEEFQGILVTDFWAAYNVVSCLKHQCCLFHLLNELEKVSQRNRSQEWSDFCKKSKRLIKDAIRLRAQEDYTPEKYESNRDRLYARLLDLALAVYADKDARRLAKRLMKYRDELFVFLKHPNVPSTNNHAEREIRTAVLMRKNIYGNRSENGALTQSVLMTVFRTLKRRGYNPIHILVSALAEYVRTGQLPPFPPVITSTD